MNKNNKDKLLKLADALNNAEYQMEYLEYYEIPKIKNKIKKLKPSKKQLEELGIDDIDY